LPGLISSLFLKLMKKLKSNNKVLRFIRLLYLKIFRINDSPQKIAQGMALGVFVGIMPGMGPVIALFLAFIFRTNRASALLGSFFTNTWMSVLTFLLSIKIGSAIIGLDWHVVYEGWLNLTRHFQWKDLLDPAILRLALALVTGYLVIAIVLGVVTYLLALVIAKIRHAYKNRIKFPR